MKISTTDKARLILAEYDGNISEAAAFVGGSSKDYRSQFRQVVKGNRKTNAKTDRKFNAAFGRLRLKTGQTKAEWKSKVTNAKKNYRGRIIPEAHESRARANATQAAFKRLGVPYMVSLSQKIDVFDKAGDFITYIKYAKKLNYGPVLADDSVQSAVMNLKKTMDDFIIDIKDSDYTYTLYPIQYKVLSYKLE